MDVAPATSACVGSALFTDLVGFTEFNDAVGDAAAVRVLEAQTAMAGRALNGRANARIVKELGDGLMMWFESAADAVDTATSLMNAIEHARATGDFPLSVRMGIHHGEALPRGDDVVGQTINIAARVADLAGPGELLVSDRVIEAFPDRVNSIELMPVGPVVVKGVREPIWLQRLTVS